MEVVKVQSKEKEAWLIQPGVSQAGLVRAPLYGYLYNPTEKLWSRSAPIQMLGIATGVRDDAIIAIATKKLHVVRSILSVETLEYDPDLFDEKTKIRDSHDPEMKVCVIPGIRLKIAEMSSENYKRNLLNVRRGA